jgi:hypothetical protein
VTPPSADQPPRAGLGSAAGDPEAGDSQVFWGLGLGILRQAHSGDEIMRSALEFRWMGILIVLVTNCGPGADQLSFLNAFLPLNTEGSLNTR